MTTTIQRRVAKIRRAPKKCSRNAARKSGGRATGCAKTIPSDSPSATIHAGETINLNEVTLRNVSPARTSGDGSTVCAVNSIADTSPVAALMGLFPQRQACVKHMILSQNQARAAAMSWLGVTHKLSREDSAPLAAQAVRLALGDTVSATDPGITSCAEAVGDLIRFLYRLIEPIEAARKDLEKAMTEFAKQLPVAEWWKSNPGLDLFGLGLLVGCAGDIGEMKTSSSLCRRMGVGVVDGFRQGNYQLGEQKGDAAVAIVRRHYYSGIRRSLMYVIANPLIMGNFVGKGDAKAPGRYRRIYEHQKSRSKADPAKADWKPMRHHLNAHRRMASALLRDTWHVWHGDFDPEIAKKSEGGDPVPPTNPKTETDAATK